MADAAPLAAQPWVSKAVAFNLSPLKDLDESWLQTIPNGRLLPHLRGAAAERWVSRHLLDAFDLAGRYWEDFSAPRARLALLDRQTLQAVLFHVGLVLRGGEIRGELNGARVKQLRAEIGAAAMDFVVKVAPLYGAVPELAYEPELADPRARLMLIGAAYSVHRTAAADAAYIMRLAFKLPNGLCDGLLKLANAHSSDDAGDSLPRVTRRVIKDLVPQWLALFD